MSTRDRQEDAELRAVSRGCDRYRADLAANRERDREYDGGPGRSFITRAMTRLIPGLRRLAREARQRRQEALRTGNRRIDVDKYLEVCRPDHTAYITIRTVLTVSTATSLTNMASRVASAVNADFRWAQAALLEKARLADGPTGPDDERGTKNRVFLARRRVINLSPRSVRKFLRELDDLETEDWAHADRVKLGLALIQALVDTCPDLFHIVEYQARHKARGLLTHQSVQLTEAAADTLSRNHALRADQRPWLEPMLCEPDDWEFDPDVEAYVGGYVRLPMPMVRRRARGWERGVHAEEGSPDRAESMDPVVVDALNTIQAVPWRVNVPVLEVARAALEHQLEAILPVTPPLPLPPRLPDEEWAQLDQPGQNSVKLERKEVYDLNHKNESKRRTLFRQVAVAEAFAGEPAIWFAHNLDFRGRAYPLAQDFHPQADDFGRSLLLFRNVKPLGYVGLIALLRHAASCYGLDKVADDERDAWVQDHMPLFFRCVDDPLGAEAMDHWAIADKPWQYLAVCHELTQAFRNPLGPLTFASSLPIHLDGSCNGLQHLSAMSRDPVGAASTNLRDLDTRQDIYQIVADKVSKAVDADALLSSVMPTAHPEELAARAWHGRVTRKVVKRGVMTVPYGLTAIGMRDQLIKDGWTPGTGRTRVDNANYLRDRMRAAIDDTVSKAAEVMQWLKDNAEILAKNGHPVSWVSPSGFRVTQGYYRSTMIRIRTVVGVGDIKRRRSASLHLEHPDLGLRIRKQQDAIAPNIIHSFDAAHMMLTVLAAGAEGVHDIAVIHDSFGAHACNLDVLGRALREEFVGIYTTDWMSRLQSDFRFTVGADVPLVEPPDMGSYDIYEILSAKWAFHN